MKIWALLIDGIVREITDLDPEGRFHKDLVWIEAEEGVEPGWTHDGEEFAPPPARPEPEEPVEVEPPKPSACSPAQGLVALYALKSVTEDDILALVEAIPDPVQRYTAKIAYTRATEWSKESITVQMLAAALDLSDEELDELFAYAVTVQV